MSINNSALYDSVLAGIAASNQSWMFNSSSPSYLPALQIAQVIATTVDAQIPIIQSGITTSQRTLMLSIVKSVMAGRYPTSLTSSNYTTIANAIAAAFVEFNTGLLNLTSDGTLIELSTPQLINNGGAGGYINLNADNGDFMIYDATNLGLNEKIEVGIDATVTNVATNAHSELRANRTYVSVGGVLTLLNDSTVFSPVLVAGNAAIQFIISGDQLILQGYQAAAGGINQKYVGSLYVSRSVVS